MGETKLNLEINPRRIKLFNMVQNAWKQEHIKQKITEVHLMCTERKIISRNKFQQCWNQMEKEIIDSITSTTTQEDLDHDLPFVVHETGQRISQWLYYMCSASRLFDSKADKFEEKMYFGVTEEAFINYCLNEICWTDYGWVDELKTFSAGFLDKPDIDDFKKFLFACLLCDKHLVDLLWEKLPNDVKDSDHFSYLKDSRTCIIAYWISLKKSTLQTFMDEMNAKYFNENRSVEENFLDLMFSDCHQCAYYNSAVLYFLKKLNHELFQKNASVWFRKICKLNTSLPILLYLYNEMSEDTRQIAFTFDENEKLALTFLKILTVRSAYPFQELLPSALSQLKSYLSNSDYASLFYSLVDTTFDIMREKNELLLKLLPVLWKILPASAKVPTVEKILYYLFEFWDIQNLKIIINDKDLREKRETLIRIGYKKFMELVWENKFDMINQFIDEILISEDWENDVKVKVKKIYQILLVDLDVKSAEEYLNSQFNKSASYLSQIFSFLSSFIFSGENRKSFLKKINHEIVIYYFFGKNRMELIREFFEKIYPDDLKTFKESIKNNPFTLDLINGIWLQPKDFLHGSPENICNEFLFWMFDSKTDDVVAFRNNVMLKDLRAGNWMKLFILLSMANSFDMIHEFFSWSSFTEKEIRKIKSALLRFAVPEKFEELMEKGDLVNSKKLLDWAFKSEKNKRKFKSRFISSRKGFTALIKLIGTIKSEEKDPNLKLEDIAGKLKNFINFWMESFEDMAVVQKNLEEYRDYEKTEYKKEDKENKITLISHGDSTEADSSEDENDLRQYFCIDSMSLKMEVYIRDLVIDKKNLDLFLNVLVESMKEKLRVMKMSK